MPIRRRGGTGGGVTTGLGPVQNTFASVAARNTYAGANADWLAQYNANRSFWVQVGVDLYRRNAAGDDWESVTEVVRGPAGQNAVPTDTATLQGLINMTNLSALQGQVTDAQVPALVARDAEVATAISNLRGGVAAAYDTLDELADALIASGSESNGIITLTQLGGGTIEVDATSLMNSGGLTESQINTLIQTALEAAVQGTENGISVEYVNGVYTFDVTSGGGLTLATVLAAILGGNDIEANRDVANQVTINYIGTGGGTPTPAQTEQIYYGTVSAADEAAAIALANAIDVDTLSGESAVVAGHNITLGPTTQSGDFFLILVPVAHVLLSMINQGTQANDLPAWTRTLMTRQLGAPVENYYSYVFGPVVDGGVVTYRLTLTE